MMSHGRQKMMMLVLAPLFFLVSIVSEAASLTVRDVQLQGNGGARILMDGAVPKGGVSIEYVRDIVQLSIPNATIYPARILHAESGKNQAFNKIFAYQYAPNLVRIRFSVDGKAEAYEGKVKFENRGKFIEVSFPGQVPSAESSESHEKSLIAKVLAQVKDPVPADPVKVEEKAPVEAPAVMKQERQDEKLKLKASNSPKVSELGGKAPGPSAFRALLAMFLIVGGLGLVLLYFKKKGASSQAKRVGDSWLSGILSGGKKQKPYIEVLANHALGPKQSITVVRIKDQQFVLGVTQDSVQLITQIDSEDADLDLLDDPKVADSIGRMFGAPVKAEAPKMREIVNQPQVRSAPTQSFDALLKGSSGAGAIIARNAYQGNGAAQPMKVQVGANSESGVRDQIKKRLQGMRPV